MTLGQRIQELRKNMGFSQEELGERMGVSRQAISKWEGDQTTPELDKLIALSKLFGLTVGQLLGVEQPVPAPGAPKASRNQKILLAGMGALLLILIIAVGALWAQVQTLSRQAVIDEEYVYNGDRIIFETAEYSFSGAESDPVLDIALKPVKQLRGWEIIGLTINHPGELVGTYEHTVSIDRKSGSASVSLSDHRGYFGVNAVFREKKTSRTFSATVFSIHVPTEGEIEANSIEIETHTARTGYLPKSVYLSLPDALFGD